MKGVFLLSSGVIIADISNFLVQPKIYYHVKSLFGNFLQVIEGSC